MNNNTVFSGKIESGLNVIIRYPAKDDLNILHEYINTLSREQTFIRFQGEEVTLQEEKRFLNAQLKKIKNHTAILLLVFNNNKLIGISGIDLLDKIEKHIGVFGISVAHSCRNKGVGKILMETVIEEGKEKIKQLKIITLGVFANNQVAQSLYRKYGFNEYGRLPGGIYYKNRFIDHIFFYKSIK